MFKQNLKVREGIDIWSLRKLETFISYSLIFLLPTQLAFHFWSKFSYVFGVRVDYLSIAVYLTDILIVLLLSLSFINEKAFYINLFKKIKKPLLGILAFAIVNIVTSSIPAISLYRFLKVFLFFLLFVYFRKNKENLLNGPFLKIFKASLIFVSVVGIIQFLINSNIGGMMYFFGERILNSNQPGIALINFFGNLKLRAYSTFSHPNSMAGYLGLSILFLFVKEKKVEIVPLLALFATFSVSAITSFFLLLFILVGKWKIKGEQSFLIPLLITLISLVFILFDNLPENVSERIDLLYSGFQTLKGHFLLGNGFGTYVMRSPILQPVHNIFVLILNETGILGFAIYLMILFKFIKKEIKVENVILILFVFITASVDHYWLTLQQNLFLLPLIFGLL